jgi:hypothetical protein
VVTADDVTLIRQLIAENPRASRRRLSEKLCEVWQWRQANGALRAMVCRGLLLMLHRAGEIELPPVRFKTLNPFVVRATPTPMLVDTTAIAGVLKELRPVELQQVRRTGDEPLFNSLMEQHHYLKYGQQVGEHLKYLAWAQGRPIACLAWSSAPRHLGSRDRYIGWSAEARRRNIRFSRIQHAVSDSALGPSSASGLTPSRAYGRGTFRRLVPNVQPSDLFCGNLH